MLLGIVMAASKNHNQMPAHAHILLVGFVVSFIYALCHKLWLNNISNTLAKLQFYAHQIGAFVMLLSLFLLYGNMATPATLDPILAVSSILVWIGIILMALLFMRNKTT
ncbi:MAG: TonB-dependent receptor [Pusillimonas sp.]|nr:TonB-dependent receptor [Pusillimonas sp.]